MLKHTPYLVIRPHFRYISNMNAKTNIILVSCLASILAAGCSSSQQSAPKQEVPPNPEAVRLKEDNRERALKHFVDGTLYDSKGDYAKAVLEYQDALLYDKNPAIYYALSKDYSLLGKHALAAKAGQQAIDMDSSNMTYRENLASVYRNAFQPELAAKEYEKMIKLDSNYTSAWYNLARIEQAHRPLKAIEIYERLLDREGESWELLLQLGELYSALGRYDEAAERYRRLMSLDPSNRALQRQLAETYVRAGKVDDAITILEDMVERDDSDIDVTVALADAYLEKREFEKAMKLYEELLKKQKDNPQVKIRVGIAYFGRIQSDSSFQPKARQMFEEASKELPNDWRPYWYLGVLADMEQNDSTAFANFLRVTQLEGGTVEAWWYVGRNYFDRGEDEEAIELMERGKKYFPKDYRVYLLLGLSYSRLQRNEKAVENLWQSLKLNPNDINALSSLALTLDGMKQFQQSDSLYEQALKIDPTSDLVLNNYSYSLAERGLQLERALKMATQAVNADSMNASYLDTIGWVHYMLGNYSEARRYIQKAIDHGEASAVVHEHLGDVYFRLGNKDQAMKWWKLALEKDQNNESLKTKITKGTL